MSSLSISLEGVIVLQVLTYLAVVGVFVLRIWILWDVASTRPFLFTTLSHAIFTLCVLASLGFLSAFTTIEYKARREVHTEEEVFERLFTIPISKTLFGVSLLYTTFIWALKGAFLGYFHEFRRHLSNRLRIYLNLVSGFVVGSYLLMMLLQFTLCLPIKRNWSIGADRCQVSEQTPGAEVQLATNVFSDLLLLSIPVLTVRSLKLPRSEKYAISAILLVGSVVPLMAITRFAIVWEIAHQGKFGPDQLRTNIAMAAVEALMADITFFLPALRVFYRRLKWDKPVGTPGNAGIEVCRTITVQYDVRGMNNSEAELTTWKPDWDQTEVNHLHAPGEAI